MHARAQIPPNIKPHANKKQRQSEYIFDFFYNDHMDHTKVKRIQGIKTWAWVQEQQSSKKESLIKSNNKTCYNCGVKTSPQWRKGPAGLNTLCNKCALTSKRQQKANNNRLNETKPVRTHKHSNPLSSQSDHESREKSTTAKKIDSPEHVDVTNKSSLRYILN